MKVCKKCLDAITSREGDQKYIDVAVDETDEIESMCEWCKETAFDTLFEI